MDSIVLVQKYMLCVTDENALPYLQGAVTIIFASRISASSL
jgi:hypothetical protein